MNLSRITRAGSAALAGTLALSLAACGSGDNAAQESSAPTASDAGSSAASSAPAQAELSGTISATGASSQVAAQEAWQAGFQTLNPDVTVNYESTGSGAGRDNFLAGASEFIGSDRAFNDEEIAAGGFKACTSDDIVEIPVYISPVAVAFNLPGVETLNLDAATIAGIFAGTITTWNDPAITAQNEGVELPDTAITPIHRSDKSGTTGTFTTYLDATASDVWTYGDVEEWPFEGGEAADKTSGVAQAISAGEGTIGYLDASQVPSGAGLVHVKVGDEYVAYSADAAAALVENSPLAEGRGSADIVFTVDPAEAPAGSYPIALVSYLIGCVNYADATTAELVKAYFTYVTSEEGQSAAAENAGSAPITDGLRATVQEAIDQIVTK